MRVGFWTAAAAALALVLGWAGPAASQSRPARVFAASSLTDALNTLGDAYAASGRRRPVFNFAASSVLARQIDQGANADLFISADEPWMDYLAERRLIDVGSRVSILSNRLVLIAPRSEAFALEIRAGFPLRQMLRGRRLAMADPDSVPAGRYGRAALQTLGVWSAVQGDVVRAESVRAALRYVELGEAAAGIVYLSDARASGSVVIVGEFPAASYPRISYPMAIVRSGRSAEARAFAAFLQSEAADRVFAQLGFIVQ